MPTGPVFRNRSGPFSDQGRLQFPGRTVARLGDRVAGPAAVWRNGEFGIPEGREVNPFRAAALRQSAGCSTSTRRVRRFAASWACCAAAAVFASALSAQTRSDTIGVHGPVTTIPAGTLIRRSANFFDLEEKTLTFTPNGSGGYTVAVGALTWDDPGLVPVRRLRELVRRARRRIDEPSPSSVVTVDLPFAFPFAGRTWTRVYANRNANISFQQPEHLHWPHRDPWSDGTMRSVAAAVDSRSTAGLEAMIAVLWAPHGDTTISVDSTPARVVITWRAMRPIPTRAYHAPLGENLFQARLYPSGTIELAYRVVPERDGVVGLFNGMNARGRTLDAVDDAVGDVARGVLDITRIEWIDNGSTVLVRMTLAEAVPREVADGEINYRVFLSPDNSDCRVYLEVSADGHRAGTGECGPAPAVVGYRVDGATLEIPISKTLLNGAVRFSWDADAVWWGRGQYDQMPEIGTVQASESDPDLRAIAGTATGNVFEVFHYPSIPKGSFEKVLSFIYERAPANDEIAIMFTDFRIDDFFNTGPGTGPINEPVQGIGVQAYPGEGERYRSEYLLVSMSPVFIGTPVFDETGVAGGRAFRNFAPGVGWIGHEAVHRWAAHLRFRNFRSGRIEDLFDDGCRCHWDQYLHAPAVYPVWPSFLSEPYPESSNMGGRFWVDNADGTFTREEDDRDPFPHGLSALDLYVMGMIPPSEVPDTFLLTDVQPTDTWGTVRATKVPVRIEDVVAAMGPRVPAADMAQREFSLGIYLLHEDGRPPRPDLLERAQAISPAITEYFDRATGGRMRVVPTAGRTQ